MKNLIIKDKKDFRVLIVYPNLPLMLIPAISVGLFTSILKNFGYQLELFETTHYFTNAKSSSENRVSMLNVREFDPEIDLGIQVKKGDMFIDFRRKIIDYNPDAIIFSVVEDVFFQTEKLLKIINDLGKPVLVGGVFPTYAPLVCLESEFINLIATGEGETVVIEFCERVRKNKSLKSIPGTHYKSQNGKITKTPQPPLVDLNGCHPDFSLFDQTRFYRPMGGKVFKMIPIESYRGCPYKCTYCNSPSQITFARENDLGNFLRRKTMDNLKMELKNYIAEYDPTFFYFVDDSFLARPKDEIYEFCKMYKDIQIPFWFNSRSETVDKQILMQLKEVGCYRISFGIECGNEQYRTNILQRFTSNKKLLEKFSLVEQSGIPFSLNVIVGMPGETRDLVMDTVELVRSINGYDALTVSIFTPYHGTVLRDVAEKNGWLDTKAVTKHTTSSSILDMPEPYLSSDEIDGIAAVFPLYTYFPKNEWAEIEKAEQNNSEGLMIREKYSKIYSKEFLGDSQFDSQRRYNSLNTKGCNVDPKSEFRISPKRLSQYDLELLTLQTNTS